MVAEPYALAVGFVLRQQDAQRTLPNKNTAIAYRKHAIDLGYSHVAGGQREKDATDGGQDILKNFLFLDLTSMMSCPRLLMLAEKTRSIASSWGQQHRQLIFNDIKATNASPTKGVKNMAKAVVNKVQRLLPYHKRRTPFG